MRAQQRHGKWHAAFFLPQAVEGAGQIRRGVRQCAVEIKEYRLDHDLTVRIK